jgi:iron-sulfur cluster repair protein YtfE (RIC family)
MPSAILAVITMSYVDQPIASVIANTSNGEDVLEDSGIDYWFGCDATLGEACAARHVDPADVVSRLSPLPERSGPMKSAPESLSAILEELNAHLAESILPALQGIKAAAIRVPESGRSEFSSMVNSIEDLISTHEELVRTRLVRPVEAIEATAGRDAAPPIDRRVLQQLALHHALLAFRIRELTEFVSRVAAEGPAEATALITATRQLRQQLHHHIRIGYNNVMPRLVALAAATKPRDFEPW